jgi:hypothetical protein
VAPGEVHERGPGGGGDAEGARFGALGVTGVDGSRGERDLDAFTARPAAVAALDPLDGDFDAFATVAAAVAALEPEETTAPRPAMLATNGRTWGASGRRPVTDPRRTAGAAGRAARTSQILAGLDRAWLIRARPSRLDCHTCDVEQQPYRPGAPWLWFRGKPRRGPRPSPRHDRDGGGHFRRGGRAIQ